MDDYSRERFDKEDALTKYALQRDIATNQHLISWSQMPSWDALVYVLSLSENNLFSFQDRHGVLSVKQLARYLNLYRKHRNIMVIVHDIYQKLKIKRLRVKDSILMMQLKHHFTYIAIGFSIPFLKLYGWWIACNDMFVSGIM